MIPEQPIDTRFPGQQFPVGSVVTLLDRDRRTVFPASAELRRHEAIVAGGETGRWRVRYAGLRLIKAGPTGERRCGRSETTPRNCSNATSTRTRWRPGGRFRFETATGRAGICRHDARTIALSVSYRRAASVLGRHPRHAAARDRTRDRRARPRARRRMANGRAAHRLHGEALQHRHAQPEPVELGSARGAGTGVPPPPDGETAPTLDLPAAGLARHLENQRPRGRPLTAATREPACQDCPQDPMIDPMATSAVKRPSSDLRRPRGREALSAHPPTPLDDTTRGSLERPAENTWAPPATATMSISLWRPPQTRVVVDGSLR